MPTNKDYTLKFIREINRHDVEGIGRLMSDDHEFIDAHGNSVEGKEKMCAGWKHYFELFPDYAITVSTAMEHEDMVLLSGEASGSYQGLGKSDPARSWKLPAAWKATFKSEKVKLWQVYADTKIPFEILQKYAVPVQEPEPEKVLGFGGVFLKTRNPKDLARWYDTHLGTQFGGGKSFVFQWRQIQNPGAIGQTVFGLFKAETKYFDPSTKQYMLNFRVKDLAALLEKLKKEGVEVVGKVESYDYGRFGWIMDPEGNKIEIWEPMGEGT